GALGSGGWEGIGGLLLRRAQTAGPDDSRARGWGETAPRRDLVRRAKYRCGLLTTPPPRAQRACCVHYFETWSHRFKQAGTWRACHAPSSEDSIGASLCVSAVMAVT